MPRMIPDTISQVLLRLLLERRTRRIPELFARYVLSMMVWSTYSLLANYLLNTAVPHVLGSTWTRRSLPALHHWAGYSELLRK